jgi:hypothetical protein
MGRLGELTGLPLPPAQQLRTALVLRPFRFLLSLRVDGLQEQAMLFGNTYLPEQVGHLSNGCMQTNSAGIAISGVGYIVVVDADALTLTDNFEVVTGIVPSATNSQAEYLVNATKPAQTAGGASWGAGASTGGVFTSSGDGQFEASMHAVFTAVVPASFYTLYKTTLGTGLGLP